MLIADEWPAPYSHTGRGDLVYHFDGIYYVIELKWIDYHDLKTLPECGKMSKPPIGRRKIMLENRLVDMSIF
jgi:hypothetical protein